MIYTEGRGQSKSLGSPLLIVRLWAVRLWLRLMGPRWTIGVMVLLTDESGRVCLLKHKGRIKPWGPPGGLIRWPESPEEGLRRELHEELGWSPASNQRFLLHCTLVSEKFQMLELVFKAELPVESKESAQWKLQSSEILDACWLSSDEIDALEGVLDRHRALLVDVLRRP